MTDFVTVIENDINEVIEFVQVELPKLEALAAQFVKLKPMLEALATAAGVSEVNALIEAIDKIVTAIPAAVD